MRLLKRFRQNTTSFIVVMLCFNSTIACAQKDFEDRFLKAREYFLLAENEKAIQIYKNILTEKSINQYVLLLANYYLGETLFCEYDNQEYTDTSGYQTSEKYFLDIYREYILKNQNIDDKKLRKFASIPYKQVLHNTLGYLAEINIKIGKYRNALDFTYLTQSKFPSLNLMYLDAYFDAYYLDEWLFKCYLGLQQPDSAAINLLPYITKGSITASEAQNRLLELVAVNQQIKEDLRKSLNTVQVLENESNPAYFNVSITYKDFTVLIDSVKLTEVEANNSNDLQKIYSTKLKDTFLYESLTEDIQIPSESYIQRLRHQDFKGKYTLLDFWASWCAPCRAENPTLIEAYQQFKDKGFEIVSISIDTDTRKWQKAIEEDQIGIWKHLIDTTGWESEILEKYSIQSIPANFLISPEGKIIAFNLRGEALLKKLEELLGE